VLCPGDKLPFQPTSAAVNVVVPDRVTFQLLVTLAGSSNARLTNQELIEVLPLLVTVISNW
jgi:hypothetical protein